MNQKHLLQAYISLISLAIFLFIKVYTHIFIYRRIKYLEDGRDYVSEKEFVSIHMTFSLLHSLLSYYLVYNFISSIGFIIDEFVQQNVMSSTELIFSYEVWSIWGLLFLFLEMSVYLTYYKDVIFSLVTIFNYIGMQINIRDPDNKPRKIPQDQADLDSIFAKIDTVETY